MPEHVQVCHVFSTEGINFSAIESGLLASCEWLEASGWKLVIIHSNGVGVTVTMQESILRSELCGA